MNNQIPGAREKGVSSKHQLIRRTNSKFKYVVTNRILLLTTCFDYICYDLHIPFGPKIENSIKKL